MRPAVTRVRNTLVFGTYVIDVAIGAPADSKPKLPPRRGSSSEPNTDGESKRGKHSHSMCVVGATSARTRPLPMTP